MPSYSVGSADMKVANTAYAQAKKLKASSKVILALFEAAFVESGVRNLNHGDRDSVGFLQQRPSQGWPDPTNVVVATTSFVNKAKKLEGKYDSSAKLAQAVQVSAFPERYGQASSAATSLLKKIDKDGGWISGLPDPGDVIGKVADNDLIQGVRQVGTALTDIGGSVAKGGRVAEQLMKLALPTNMMRLVVGMMGVIFVFIGIYALSREVRK